VEGAYVRVATWPSVVRRSAECINVVKAGVISRGVTHTVAWLESQTCSSRNARGSKVGRACETGQVADGGAPQ
jgi:hypothetical protein